MYSNKKKIRGWRRRAKILEWWGEWICKPHLLSFESRGKIYEKCIIDPFYRLEKRQPPLWFFKIIVSKLVVAFENWNKTFKELDQPYDLQLWIYEPHFIYSQLVCDRLHDGKIKVNYFDSMKNQYEFPFEKFSNGNINELKKFEWIRCAEETYIEQYDIDEGDFTLEDILADGYEKGNYNNGDIYYSKIIGNVWVGRVKKETLQIL